MAKLAISEGRVTFGDLNPPLEGGCLVSWPLERRPMKPSCTGGNHPGPRGAQGFTSDEATGQDRGTRQFATAATLHVCLALPQ